MSKIATKLFRLNPELFDENIPENLKQIRAFIQNNDDNHDNRYDKKEVKQALSNKGFQFELYVQIGQQKNQSGLIFYMLFRKIIYKKLKVNIPPIYSLFFMKRVRLH